MCLLSPMVPRDLTVGSVQSIVPGRSTETSQGVARCSFHFSLSCGCC